MWTPDPSVIVTAAAVAEADRSAMYVPLSPRQFWLAASRIGITKDMVLVAVASMDDADVAADLKIEIMEATRFERGHPSMNDLAALLSIPSAQFDDLWVWASHF